MSAILYALGMAVADLVKPRARLEAEILLLRHQLSLALRNAPPRVRLDGSDCAFMVWMVRLWPSLFDVIRIVQSETALRWYRAGFRIYWRWKGAITLLDVHDPALEYLEWKLAAHHFENKIDFVPLQRPIQRLGRAVAVPILAGLHHHVRI